jgi:transposase
VAQEFEPRGASAGRQAATRHTAAASGAAQLSHRAARGGPPEAPQLAETIQTWRPAILVALTEDAYNARTEGLQRIIKQTKRVGCGYRNLINGKRRILSHIAVIRPQKSAA